MTDLPHDSSILCTGSGTPTLVLVHGGFCDRGDWDAQVNALSGQHRIVTFDLPGHGRSPPPDEVSIAAFARTMSETQNLHAGGSAVLVGHSLGCRVVLEAVRRCSAGIAGVVLIDNDLIAQGDADAAAAALRARISAVGLRPFLIGAFEGMFVATSSVALRERVLARIGSLDDDFAQSLLLSTLRWDVCKAASALAAVTVPLLVLQSTYADGAFGRRSMQPGISTPWLDLVNERVADAEIHMIPDVGHFAQIEAADIVNARIGEFAGRLG